MTIVTLVASGVTVGLVVSMEVSVRIRTTVVVLALVSSVLWASPILAQGPTSSAASHVVGSTQLYQAVADQVLVDQRNRETVIAVLQQPQVQEVAGRLGMTVAGAESAVTAMSGAELAGVAAAAQAAGADLAGGTSRIVMSVTTLLLIIIIVILLV